MASFLKSIDLFSTKFTFTIGKNAGYSTLLGSILTFVTAVAFVIFFIVLGNDFLYKKNARTSTSKYIETHYEKISLHDFNITIAISLKKTASNAKPINITGGYFWSDYSYTRKYYNETEDKYLVTYESLIPKPCSDLSYQPSMNFSNDYLCVEFPADSYLGSNQRESHHYLFSLFNCENKVPNGVPGKKCNKLSDLKAKFKEENSISYYFHIYHPVLYYDPRDKINPAKVNYELIAFPFNFNLQRQDSLYFHKSVVNEDTGWWFPENHNQTFWTVESKDYSFDYKSDADLTAFLASSKFYSFELGTSLKHNYYTRSYMKIQEVLAVVATVIKIIMMAFEMICMFINTSFIRYHIFKKLFSISRTNSQKNSISLYSNNHPSKLNLVNLSKSNNWPPSTLIASKATPFSSINLKPFRAKNRSKAFNRCFALKRTIGAWLFRKSEEALVERYDQGDMIVRDKMDIDNYIRMIYDIIILQKSIFNDTQFFSLNYLKKANIFNSQEIQTYFNIKTESSEEMLRKYVCYFSNQMDRAENSEMKDKLILNMMKDSYKFKLLSKKQLELK